MEANRRRTDNFHDALLKNGFGGIEKNGFGVDSISNGGEECVGSAKREDDTNSGSLGAPDISLSTIKIEIIGEPVERLYLWGHSSCTLDNIKHNKILIFGGFGGMGRHSRRNDSLLLDLISGEVEAIDAQGTPSPRLGHTANVVGDVMFVIGGREGPVCILNDVLALNTKTNQWKLLPTTGCLFPPRHRHAAAVVGAKIYIFGGTHNDVISSSLYVLDTENLVWNEIHVKGEWPCPRHSHSLVGYNSHLYMFGGYDGEKALRDLYSFDVQTCLWKEEKMEGRKPYARFSHSMFVYKNYIGIVGGCPVRESYQELSILDLRSSLWIHVLVNSISEGLLVRSTASIVGDDLVLIGGGAACYAFGTKFSEPIKINLLPLVSLPYSSTPTQIAEKHVIYQALGSKEANNGSFGQNANEGSNLNLEHQSDDSHWVLQLEKKYAKQGKDILKKFGWLDLARKAYSKGNGPYICFPVTAKFRDVYQNDEHKLGDVIDFDAYCVEEISLKDISCSSALNLLTTYGGTKLVDVVVKVKRNAISPLEVMKEAVASLINQRGLPAEYLEELPSRWERLGDIVVLPATSFKNPIWESFGEELWPLIAKSLGTHRLARQGRVAPNGTRDSTLEILVGENGWVEHCENGILYSFDTTKCMFSWGNLSEKLRMARMNCRDEVIVDLFAGIGYFTLPFLVRANAKMVYACEWNPHAVEALQRNLQANSVSDRCVVFEGDNKFTAPKGVADRVCLGLLPTSEGSWVSAVRALRKEGGILHVHDNVKDSEENTWREHVSKSIKEIAASEGFNWDVLVEHVERVKWYAPHIRHLVADVRCKTSER